MMAEKLPIVYVDGALSQLPVGDSVDASDLGSVVAISGLVGGGDLNTGDKRVDVALATNPSGIIFVGDTVGYDGVALADADLALASGSQALADANSALTTSIAVEELAKSTLEFNNAVLDSAVNFAGASQARLVAGSTVTEGTPCGLNGAGEVETIRLSAGGDTMEANTALSITDLSSNLNAVGTALNTNYSRIYTVYCNTITGAYQTYISVTDVNVEGGSTTYTILEKDILAVPVSDGGQQLVKNQPIVFCPEKNAGAIFTMGVNSGYLYATSFYDNGASSSSLSFGTPTVVQSSNLIIYNPAFASCSCGADGYIFLCYYESVGDNTFMIKIRLNNSLNVVPSIEVGLGQPLTAYQSPSAECCFNSKTNTITILNVDERSGTRLLFITQVDFTADLQVAPATQFVTQILPYWSGFSICETPNSDATNGGCCVSYFSDGTTNETTLADFVVNSAQSGYGLVLANSTDIGFNLYESKPLADPNTDELFLFYRSASGGTFEVFERSNPAFGSSWVTKQGATVVPNSSPLGSFDTCYAASGVTETAFGFVQSNQYGLGFYESTGDTFRNTTTTAGQVVVPLLFGSQNNFIGIASETAASGSVVRIDTPCSVNIKQENLTTGLFYYLDVATSGITTISGNAEGWVNNNPPPTLPNTWLPVGKAVSSSGIIVLNTF